MAEKKKSEKKIKTVSSVPKTQVVAKEDTYFAIELAKIYNVSSFQFLMLKRKENISENSLLTMTEFLKILEKNNIKR